MRTLNARWLRAALAVAIVLCAGLFAADALAKKKKRPPKVEEPAKQEDTAEELFAKSFIGRTYENELEVEGWTDLGGGLVSPPIYIRQYRNEGGIILVLTSREVTKATGKTPASYTVAGTLVVPPPKGGAQFSIACVKDKDATLKYLGEAKGKDSMEWWTDVRRAWEISLETGEIAEIKPKGIRCTNAAWGQ